MLNFPTGFGTFFFFFLLGFVLGSAGVIVADVWVNADKSLCKPVLDLHMVGNKEHL